MRLGFPFVDVVEADCKFLAHSVERSVTDADVDRARLAGDLASEQLPIEVVPACRGVDLLLR